KGLALRRDFDSTRLRFRLLLNRDLEDAVAAASSNVLRIDAVRENEAAVKAPAAPLDAHSDLALVLIGRLLGRTLARQREHAVRQCHVHFAGLDTRQIDVQLEAIVVLVNIDRRDPGRSRTARLAFIERVEQAVDLLPQLSEGEPLTACNQSHKQSPPIIRIRVGREPAPTGEARVGPGDFKSGRRALDRPGALHERPRPSPYSLFAGLSS